MEILPKLYKLDSNHNITEWEISVIERDNGEVHIVTKHGVKNGKIQIEQRAVKGKNIGRANETTAFEQGVREATKKWTDKQKNGYTPDIKKVASHKPILPMLAKQYDTFKHYLQIPYAVQPKLDGMRALITYRDGKIVITSRLGNEINSVPGINQELLDLKMLKPHWYLDGELYTLDYPFEELIGLLKSDKITEVKAQKLARVKFYAFDFFDTTRPQLTFKQRYKFLSKLVKKFKPKRIVLVPTNISKVLSTAVAKKIRDRYIKQGNEGAMFRNLDSVYEINKRSSNLLKYKKTLDAEYEIIGFVEGKGRAAGTPVFWLKTPQGDKFKAKPSGTYEQQHRMFLEADKLVGQMATVEFQELSKKGVPRFPILIRIRRD